MWYRYVVTIRRDNIIYIYTYIYSDLLNEEGSRFKRFEMAHHEQEGIGRTTKRSEPNDSAQHAGALLRGTRTQATQPGAIYPHSCHEGSIG